MRKLPTLLAILCVAVLVPTAASAQTEPETVTLEASASTLTIGDDVRLSGEIAPATGGQTVEIRDERDDVVGSATTGAAGAFSVTIAPEGTRTYRAFWNTAVSEPVTVRVRAVVTVRMSGVRLFDEVVVRGTVQPARPGRRVEVALMVGGRVRQTQRVAMGSAGGFTATFRAMQVGTYRARASFSSLDLLRGSAVSESGTPPLPSLRSGSNGPFVELLERRLVELHYRLAGAKDGKFDFRTADAVVAFHKVQRMARVFSVSAATWRALADPLLARARHDWRGFHFEVDQTRQVLLTVEDGEVTNVLHVSTGAGGATRDGSFRVFRKIAGYSGHRLYYPSYFDGLRALHGWPEVPTYAASHGCVRIPYWNAIWVHGLADYGTRVVIYH
ncbi:MAG: L,D-transpeptidase family protein [Actinomycetota bacterium]